MRSERKTSFLGDLGLVERIYFGKLRPLFVCQSHGGALRLEAFHGEFVGGFHAELRRGRGCGLVQYDDLGPNSQVVDLAPLPWSDGTPAGC